MLRVGESHSLPPQSCWSLRTVPDLLLVLLLPVWQLTHLTPVSGAILYVAGLLTSLSPCALSLVPLTMAYLTDDGEDQDRSVLNLRERHSSTRALSESSSSSSRGQCWCRSPWPTSLTTGTTRTGQHSEAGSGGHASLVRLRGWSESSRSRGQWKDLRLRSPPSPPS